MPDVGSPADPVGGIRADFAAVLDVDPDEVADDSDFFLLGGHSLLALDLAVALESRFGVSVRVRDVYDRATPAGIAELVGAAPAAAPGEAEAAAVSPAVRWLWLDRQTGGRPGTTSYTVPALFDAGPDLDPDRFAVAVGALVRHHPPLRTVFVEQHGELCAVVTDEPGSVAVVEVDTVDEYVAVAVATPFDPAAGPLLRVAALHRADGGWSVLLTADHLICDGQGLRILARDLARGYEDPAALAGVLPAAAPPPVDRDRELAHWRERLTPWPEPLPLPVLRAREGPVHRTAVVSRELSGQVVDAVARCAADARAGTFVPLAAAVARGIGEITGSTDVCLGTAVDRRARDRAEDRVGFHVTTVPLRLRVAPDASPADAVRDTAEATLDAVDHSGLHFGQLVTELAPPRLPWRNPVFDVWVVVYPWVDTGPGALRLRGGPVRLPEGLFELSFQFEEHPDGMRLDLQYDTARYDAATADWIADRVQDGLRWVLGTGAEEPAPAAGFTGFHYGS